MILEISPEILPRTLLKCVLERYFWKFCYGIGGFHQEILPKFHKKYRLENLAWLISEFSSGFLSEILWVFIPKLSVKVYWKSHQFRFFLIFQKLNFSKISLEIFSGINPWIPSDFAIDIESEKSSMLLQDLTT